MKDELGDYFKSIEKDFQGPRIEPTQYMYARIDGRGFSKFTKNMDRPFDARFYHAMRRTMKALVEDFGVDVGYCQSDEISLVWRAPRVCEDVKSEHMFGGKIQKLTSILASKASVIFYTEAMRYRVTNLAYIPHFDCRVMGLDTKREAVDVVLWRMEDASRNAIRQVGSCFFSHKQMHKKSNREVVEMLRQIDVHMSDYDMGSVDGVLCVKKKVKTIMEDGVYFSIPEKNRPPRETLVSRNKIFEIHGDVEETMNEALTVNDKTVK